MSLPETQHESRLRQRRIKGPAFAALLLALSGCKTPSEDAPASGSSAQISALPSARNAALAQSNAPAPSAAPTKPIAKPPCAEGMLQIPAAEFWMGSPAGKGADDEHPRFKTRVATFCMDATEVTVGAYLKCEEAGACKPPERGRQRCTATGSNRLNLPVNCVTWGQADAFCRWRKARLPTEVEWEYAASGGDDRKFSWGDETPDGRACWKEAGACPVARYAAGAFGLYDMTGNLWEWTAGGYGPYPFPPVESAHQVYRGGSWSRRFDKWMLIRLRNRWGPTEQGSHLGFRCAATLPGTECPFGRAPATGAGETERCLHGVLEAECAPGLAWNGSRCAPPGAPECPPGHDKTPGHGCVPGPGARAATAHAGAQPAKPMEPLRRARSPSLDADCARYQPSRPVAWRLEGATHDARTAAGSRAGCKNRDVGVGWNSACCPANSSP